MTNAINEIHGQIREIIMAAMGRAVADEVIPAVPAPAFSIETPADPSHGDFASNAAMISAKAFRLPPRKIAELLTERMDFTGTYVERVEVAGPGFINFFVGRRYFSNVLTGIRSDGADYGKSDYGKGKRVMVEFVSANPTGTMTIGNARGGVLGDAMASILAKAGWQVWREFYVNDAGNQVELFARSVEARYIQLLKGEDAVEFPEDGYHGDDIREIARLFREQFGDEWLDKPEEERIDMSKMAFLPPVVTTSAKDADDTKQDVDDPEMKRIMSKYGGYVDEKELRIEKLVEVMVARGKSLSPDPSSEGEGSGQSEQSEYSE